jgi:hypothetical protein
MFSTNRIMDLHRSDPGPFVPIIAGSVQVKSPALLRKSLISNGVGEGNRTLVVVDNGR